MSYNLHQIFKKLPQERLDRDCVNFEQLESKILNRIALESERQIKRKLVFTYLGLSVSGLATVGVFWQYGRFFIGSEFWSLLSLLFSDAQIVLRNWQDFGFSLLETLPAVELAILTVPIVALLSLIQSYFKLISTRKFSFN